MNSDLSLTLIWIAVLLFAATSIYGLWWSIYWDRPQGRRRCPKCWHTLEDRFPFRCCECGYVTIFEKNIFRTRRRWGWAVAAIVTMLLGTVWLRDQVSMRSWWTLFPDRVVILLLPWADSADALQDIPQHLAVRLERGDMSEENALRLLAQCAGGDASAPPGSDKWRIKYEAIAATLKNSLPHAEASAKFVRDLELGLNTMPPYIRLDTPEMWNAVEPVVVSARVRNWWPEDSKIELRFESASGIPLSEEALRRLRQEEWERVTPTLSSSTMFAFDLGTLPVGKHAGEIMLRWEATLPAPTPTAEARRDEGVVGIPVEIEVQAAPQPLTPISSPEIDALVREAFEPGLLRWPSGRVRHAFQYKAYNTSSSDLEEVAFGLVVEALEDGVPRRELHVWWRGGRGGSRSGWKVTLEDQEALDRASANSHWTLRIRGDEKLARRAAGLYAGPPVTKWWSGTIEMPMAVNDQSGERSGRVWMLQRYVSKPIGATR
ncbi:MAG: hypothetical protein K8R92_11535 [Planctomycetes bacterium]|nr:hypothetical protein [Planctomycetota bacterium]